MGLYLKMLLRSMGYTETKLKFSAKIMNRNTQLDF